MKRRIFRKIAALFSVVLLTAALLPCGEFRACADETEPEPVVVKLGGRVTVSATADGRVLVYRVTGGNQPYTGVNPPDISPEDQTEPQVTKDYYPQSTEIILTGSATWLGLNAAAGQTLKVTFQNVTAGSGEKRCCGMDVGGEGTVIIELDGNNGARGGWYAAGMAKQGEGELIFRDANGQPGAFRATGGDWGAGIGGSHESCGLHDGSNIVIAGGTIYATGGENGAGIGGGLGGDCGNITITGGTVYAEGGKRGAGIGGGEDTQVGTIKISGGTVYAQGGEEASGIGTGLSGFNDQCVVRISGGTVYAAGGTGGGAGIGGVVSSSRITVTGSARVYVAGGTAGEGKDAGTGIGGSYHNRETGKWIAAPAVMPYCPDLNGTIVFYESGTTIDQMKAGAVSPIDTNTVQYVVNDGKCTFFKEFFNKGTEGTLAVNKVAPEGCDCWWNTEADGSGTRYESGGQILMTEDLTLYPAWEKETVPTPEPTDEPVQTPTTVPTELPVLTPTTAPAELPVLTPTMTPTKTPTQVPTAVPTQAPLMTPTPIPTVSPTGEPTSVPTGEPSVTPTSVPTEEPTPVPTPENDAQPTPEPAGASNEKTAETDRESAGSDVKTVLVICLAAAAVCAGTTSFVLWNKRRRK